MAARLHLLPSITTAAAGAHHHHHHRQLQKQQHPPPPFSLCRRRLSASRPCWTTTTTTRTAAAGKATTTTTTTTTSTTWTLRLTYLEINSWVWEFQQQEDAAGPPLRVLVDPILVGDLDFGAPWLFNGAKKDPGVRALGVDGLLATRPPDLLLITQSLDDHCHARTLSQLSARAPDLPVVTTPNARPVLASLPTPFRRVTYLEPGQSAAAGDRVRILATAGPVLGPPWQRPENGYIITTAGKDGLLYYEPHCVYDTSFLERGRLRAEVVITPVVKQLLPAGFTLVSGQEDAVDLARLLRASYVVPMSNGDVDATGPLATVLATEGTTQSFRDMLSEALPEARVLDAAPGVPLQLQLDMPPPQQPII